MFTLFGSRSAQLNSTRVELRQKSKSWSQASTTHPTGRMLAFSVALSLMLSVIGVSQGAIAATAAVPTTAVPAATTPSNPGCPDVLFIGARGSGEQDHPYHGMGPEVDSLYLQMATDLAATPVPSLGRTLKVKSLLVVYAAADVKKTLSLSKTEATQLATALALGGVAGFTDYYVKNHVDVYLASVAEGLKSATDELTTEAKQCPNARFVLGGYSQGALVMHDLLLNLSDKNDPASNALLRRITATALIADPGKKSETAAMHFGTADLSAQGIRSALELGERDVPTPSSTYDICNLGDLVCDFSWASISGKTSFSAAYNTHVLSYQNNQMVKNIGSAIATTLLQQLPGVVDHLEIAPATVTAPVGTPQTYAATAIDPFGKPLGDVTTGTTFGISPEGSCNGAVCTTSAAGIHSVKGVMNGVIGTATLTAEAVNQHTGDVVYEVDPTDGTGTQIWIRHSADGSTAKLGDGTMADVSPDGSKIAYIAKNPDPNVGTMVTWVMNADGTNPIALDPLGQTYDYADSNPRWTPDGTKICISRNYAWDQGGYNGNGYLDLFMLSADGHSLSQLSSDHVSVGPVSWSPDGARLVFTSVPSGQAVMNVDGTNEHLLLVGGDYGQYFDPDWSPAGDRIYFDTTIYGIQYVASTDAFSTPVAALPQQLMPGTIYRDYYPRVSADGSTVVFAGYDRCLDGTPNCYTFHLFEVASAGGQPALLSGTTGGYGPSLVK
ncbi:cutinase family protein [Arthrobacter sp. ISL-85]|uniref:cutinase family protein n=1 Tax=Arthrobacter sp. ISL-85 TaxID=2819115 RepID=UPI001BE6D7D6|nr:cutinase family protein [Arthrobacter sp. ISL-85]MBT2568555.1 cutinase family protein [Arthrobacter sp. ISL-85]